QYISDRFSAPVVEKRFNPLVFARWGSPSSWFFDLGYEHESNGQAIETPDDYNAQLLIDSTVEKEHGLKYYPTETNERISRGWDFLDFNAGATNSIFGFSSLRKNTESSNNKFSYNINLKYFLSNGLLETTPENIRAWEKQDTNMTRQRVDGITIQLEDDYVLAGYLLPWVHRKLLKYNISTVPFIGSVGGGLTYTTGVLGPFEHNTFRGELDVQIYSIPLSGYYQYGYLNEVATYYQKATTIGFGVKIPMLI
ncbi:MAG TPA: hypothetical protein VN931_01880, partial [Fibrobacteria bacterium]|nr:hypothetical protein [Fibrobacteria bacterium]